MLAARASHSVSLAIVWAASLSACDASTYTDESPAAAPREKPESNADPKADTAGHLDQRDGTPAGLPAASQGGGLHEPATRTDGTSPPQRVNTDITRFVPVDTMVRMEKRGDLDDDGAEDVLLVLQDKARSEEHKSEIQSLMRIS